MVRPLIYNAQRARSTVQVRNAVLGENGKPVRVYHLRHAVVYLGIEVIRASGKHYTVTAVGVELFYYLFAASVRPIVEFRLFEVRLLYRTAYFAFGNVRELLGKPFGHAARRCKRQERRGKLNVIVYKLVAHVQSDNFGV